MIPDLVYPLKVTDDCEELRYSLRSVHTNAPGLYGRIWVLTNDTPPDWLTGVQVLPCGDGGTKAQDVRSKIAAACAHSDVSPTFLLMCDDFFLVDPITEWEPFHMGPTSAYVARWRAEGASAGWLRAVTETADWMLEQGHGDILTRQGHRPLLWDKVRLAEALATYPAGRPLDVNGLYDIAGAGGVGRRGMNSKIKHDAAEFHRKTTKRNIPWLSSNNTSFAEGMVGGYIRGLFREPSPFERR